MKNIRKKALFIIDNVFYKGAFLKEELEILKKSDISKRDYNLVVNITKGVVQNRTLLDYIIKEHSKVKFKKIHKIILTILEMGIYQIFFLDRVPEYSIINESVKLANIFGNRGSAGYVNGLLRNLYRKKDELLESKFGLMDLYEEDKSLFLSIYYSHPKYYVDMFLKDKGTEFTEDLLKANNMEPPFTIRVNTLLISREDLRQILDEKGYKSQDTTMSKFGIVIENPEGIFESEEFKKGYFYVQDEASILVSEFLNPEENSKVLDLCSAPGGKTSSLSMIMGSSGEIVACDISKSKISLIKENIARLGIKNIIPTINDAEIYNDDFKDRFDYLLLDAPCSGLGLYRKKPEIKWNRSYEDIQALSKIQKKMLKNASKYLKPGGEMIYSTCTLTKEENEDVVYNFLRENNEFSLEKINGEEILKLYPSKDSTDGFSIAKLKRRTNGIK
ncbi:16S rRNA (cytosine(967)-C(5))-methyltransferase RsmB [Anaerosphaera multitolerans]|uniref:16S rRNA (cytosine(967)-C(5))-methyltransferase n=1 Tax=Anaerosphaera multitolerans TaxID=2487351 RepID=A0A437S703_9FIRM|nr:16S rRNA (cytosine(967)-C(5))-methyltransferase RsmB [Anaerosphaera multitolerans]RVU54761.1 16S rRNA (cytosine(967)-C(5))-methyltransferase RsmB [Anaerosphaera multitolerans]